MEDGGDGFRRRLHAPKHSVSLAALAARAAQPQLHERPAKSGRKAQLPALTGEHMFLRFYLTPAARGTGLGEASVQQKGEA